MTDAAVERVRFTLSGPQDTFWDCPARYIDLEGGVRSGKTTVALLRLSHLLQEHPGMWALACRWTQESTEAQLKARIRELLTSQILGWDASEQYFVMRTVDPRTPSRLYVRGLKPSEDAARYSKFAGLTLAVVYCDQAEEVPEDFYRALQARLSQPGYPQHLILTPNPPGADHWLATEFPEDQSHADHVYIRTTVYDNREALGEAYIQALEAAYPTPAERRFYVDGRRGLSVVGEPVYGRLFRRDLHVVPDLAMHPEVPLLESWDFGQRHPAVLWAQLLPSGVLRILGEVLGTDEFLESFAPRVLAQRAQWFPLPLEVWTCCDPAGADRNSHGLNRNAVETLRDCGIHARWVPGANAPDRRDYAIQAMARLLLQRDRCQIHPRCRVLIDGLEAGYVWDHRSTVTSVLPNTRRPKKDGFYDHLQNTLEYLLITFGAAQPTRQDIAREAARALRRAQWDHDPADRGALRQGLTRRGGY